MAAIYFTDKNASRQLETDGKEFEHGVINIMHGMFDKNKKHEIIDVGEDMDKKQGTDVIIDNIHVDFTLNFENKDNMPFIYDTMIDAGYGKTFCIGVRHGNEKKINFNEEAYVVGVTMPSYEYHDDVQQDKLYECFKKSINTIIRQIKDIREDYITTDMKKRKDEDVYHALEVNPKYNFKSKKHERLLKKYKEREAVQFTLNAESEETDDYEP